MVVPEHRFSLSAYKMMNQLLKTINVAENEEDLKNKAKSLSGAIHIVTINSDLLFKNNQNWNYDTLKSIGLNVFIYEIDPEDGHDAFLIEFEQMNRFLSPIFK